MAMKVIKTTVHRLTVDMSCGCRIYQEFEDAQCKKPSLGNYQVAEGVDPPVERVFKACAKHVKDASLSMLEFLIAERLDEAVLEAQKVVMRSEHQYTAPVDVQSTLLSGDTVRSVAPVPPEIRQRSRPEDPTKVKTFSRGGGEVPKQDQTAVEMGMEAEEDENLTGSVEDVLFSLNDLDRDDSKPFL